MEAAGWEAPAFLFCLRGNRSCRLGWMRPDAGYGPGPMRSMQYLKRSYPGRSLSRAVDLMPDLIEGGEPVEVQAVCGRRLSAYRIGVYKKRYMLKYSQRVPIAQMRFAKILKIAWKQKSEHRKPIMQSPLNINATSQKRATRGLCWAGWHFLRPAPIKPRYGRLFAIMGVIIPRPLAFGRGVWGWRLFRGLPAGRSLSGLHR